MIQKKDLENRFQYHAPNQDRAVKHELVREDCLDLAERLNQTCPDSEEKNIAIRKLEEVMFWANASIARNE